MLTYQLRERRIQFLSGVSPNFPATVQVNIALKPMVPFGGYAGETRNVGDQTFFARANLSTGRFYVKTSLPLFDKLNAAVKIDTTEFRIAGNVATVRTRCASLQDLSDLLVTLHFAFPAVLNLHLPDSPYSLYVWGTAGNEKFQWHYEAATIRGSVTKTSKEHQENLVIDSWKQVDHAVRSRRLMGALHYFHTACRLLNVGTSRFEFIAESLLNMSKCLQALFGEPRDSVRNELRSLGYGDGEIEGKFIPALILRNEFDISHVSLSVLSRDELSILYRYAHVAEESFRTMLQKVLSAVIGGTYFLLADTEATLSKDKKEIIAKLDKLTKQFA